MGDNHILIIIIICLLGVVLVFGSYFAYIAIYNKRHEKKKDSIFDAKNLVEEESLLNVMDEKKNMDFKNEHANDKNTFLNEDIEVFGDSNDGDEKPINPFGVDMNKKTRENRDYVREEEERKNKKFFQ